MSAKLYFYATHPWFLLRRIGLKFYELRNPKEPWLSQNAVRFCEQNLKPNMAALEWGSGRSTPWFAKHVGRLMSVEHHRGWYDRVNESLKGQGVANVDYRFIALDHDIQAPTTPCYPTTPGYVKVVEEFAEGSLDFVVVDGHYRQACIIAALPKIRKGGYLLVDNTNWLPLADWQVPPSWKMVHQSSNVMTQTTLWQKP